MELDTLYRPGAAALCVNIFNCVAFAGTAAVLAGRGSIMRETGGYEGRDPSTLGVFKAWTWTGQLRDDAPADDEPVLVPIDAGRLEEMDAATFLRLPYYIVNSTVPTPEPDRRPSHGDVQCDWRGGLWGATQFSIGASFFCKTSLLMGYALITWAAVREMVTRRQLHDYRSCMLVCICAPVFDLVAVAITAALHGRAFCGQDAYSAGWELGWGFYLLAMNWAWWGCGTCGLMLTDSVLLHTVVRRRPVASPPATPLDGAAEEAATDELAFLASGEAPPAAAASPPRDRDRDRAGSPEGPPPDPDPPDRRGRPQQGPGFSDIY